VERSRAGSPQINLFAGLHAAFDPVTFDQLLRYVFTHGRAPLRVGPYNRSERANVQEVSSMLVAFSCVIVPTKKIDVLVLVLGELMLSVTERLILGQAALAEIFFFAANNKLIRLTESAFHHTCHHDLLGCLGHLGMALLAMSCSANPAIRQSPESRVIVAGFFVVQIIRQPQGIIGSFYKTPLSKWRDEWLG
jgi:hypothetical protein